MYGLELAFAICAAIGGILFAGHFVLQFFGIKSARVLDFPGGDLDFSNSGAGSPLLTFQSITAFLAAFGVSGLILYRVYAAGAAVSAGGGAAGGLVAAWIVGLLSRGRRQRRSATDYNPARAIGEVGTVYLTIPPGETGKVSVTVHARLCVFDAVASDKQEELAAGTAIKIVELAGRNLLIVKRA